MHQMTVTLIEVTSKELQQEIQHRRQLSRITEDRGDDREMRESIESRQGS